MAETQQQLILKTIETLLNLQLKSVRQLLGKEEVETTVPRFPGMRRQSLVHLVVNILTEEKRPLHVTELVDLLREQYGRITDRDTLSSALGKKVRQGKLIKQTGPATFQVLHNSRPGGEDKS
jgi:hypothetical protein